MTAIIGAGAAGMSLALLWDRDVRIYEQSETPGGLCRSHFVDGFTFDTGPHILGGIPHAVDWIVSSTGLRFVEGETRNIGWAHGRAWKHPFEDHATGLRYMAKMWKTDPSQLQLPGLGAQAGRKPGGVSSFRYPSRGGYQAITDAWANLLGERIHYGVRVAPRPGAISTAPVDGARYNSLVVATLGYQGKAPDLTAVYLPERWTPFHRLSFPSAFAPSNAPAGCFTIQGEISVSEDDPDPVDPACALRDVAERLALASGEPLFEHVQTVKHAYPVPVGTAEPRGVGHGRTGAHRYLNLDGVVAASMELALTLNNEAA